ncbi:uncharacterized protein LOC130949746 [Arachis stenosperma]|uniref:uncharacterized protein LOC130949746 n=1 Tax=Arachis stenosperma TaxID=217475 RepID=UPI0025ABE011|nr:uncharacterized protein LOC130949746 [Arachis stenosperma]
MEKLFYRISILVLRDDVKYDSFVISSDEDLELFFHCRRQFSEVSTPELLAKLVDVVSSSGGSNRIPMHSAMAVGSSLRPIGDSSSLPVIEPNACLVASSSFAADLDHTRDTEPVETVLDDDDDDVEPATIVDVSDHEDEWSTPTRGGEEDPAVPVGFGARDTQDTRGVVEFQVGQQFQDKEEAMLSVKTYSIRREIEYKVMESNYCKYHGKCKYFNNGCTCDHRRLNYHVISAFIPPMIRANAAISIKVLQNAIESHFDFRPPYRRVWMAKQKVMVHIYGEWEESYNEFPPTLVWTFPPCIEAFRHCKSLVSIDGTHLYGKYGETLLVAIAQDRNFNIISIAFVLVEGENAESWPFFLSHLRQHVTPQPGILVISDWHNGIKAALEAPDGGWLPSNAYKVFCIRHVATNFSLSFKGEDERSFLVNAAYAAYVELLPT